MVQALVELSGNTNRVLNVVKAKYALKDKDSAIKFVVDHYIESVNDPELRPEFIKMILELDKEEGIMVDDFGEYFGLNKIRAERKIKGQKRNQKTRKD